MRWFQTIVVEYKRKSEIFFNDCLALSQKAAFILTIQNYTIIAKNKFNSQLVNNITKPEVKNNR